MALSFPTPASSRDSNQMETPGSVPENELESSMTEEVGEGETASEMPEGKAENDDDEEGVDEGESEEHRTKLDITVDNILKEARYNTSLCSCVVHSNSLLLNMLRGWAGAFH